MKMMERHVQVDSRDFECVLTLERGSAMCYRRPGL
jgi:hypothetical protein